MPLSLADAKTRLQRLVAYDQEPTLSDTELTDLLNDTKRVSVWVTATAYTEGQRITSTGYNRRVYVCKEAGTSAATEPVWGDDHYIGQTFSDGANLVWEDAGPAFEQLYDLNAAARSGWLAKAAKVAHKFDFGTNEQKFARQQQYDHCVAMASRFEPLLIG